jgi:guanine deaminase
MEDRLQLAQPFQRGVRARAFVVLDDAATPLMARRTRDATLAERLFALQILGDDRAVRATYLRGRRAWALPA